MNRMDRSDLTLDDYKAKIRDLRTPCSCGALLTYDDLEHYDHADGYNVAEFESKQWLYLKCDECGYQMALWKLGIGRPNGEVTDRAERIGGD